MLLALVTDMNGGRYSVPETYTSIELAGVYD